MPVTLAQAQVNVQDDVDFGVIDNLRRYSQVWDWIVFDDTVNPGTGGGTLTYGYMRLTAPRTAQFRQINTEYTPQKALRQRYTADLKPHGGAYEIDRVIANLGGAATNEIIFQTQQLTVAATQRWLEEMINGDVAVDAAGFDGLNKALTGSATEFDPLDNGVTAGYLDASAGVIDSHTKANLIFDYIDLWLSSIMPSHMGGGDAGQSGMLPPGVKAILGNTRSIARLRALARWASIYRSEKNELGQQVDYYGEWRLLDMGDGQMGTAPIIKSYSADADEGGGGSTITGLTDLYAVSFGLDALHGASVAGSPLVKNWLPDYTTTGAVKTGELEIGPTTLVLKNQKAAGVLRKLKV